MSVAGRIAATSFALPGLGVIGVVALSACTRTLVLGTDCPDQVHECIQESVSEPGPGTGDELDAGEDGDIDASEPTEPEDAGLTGQDVFIEVPDLPHIPDAGSDADLSTIPVFSSLALTNPAFERNGGLGGDLVLSKLIGTLLPLPPLPLLFAELPGWYACWATTVHSLSRDTPPDAGPQSNDYLSFVVNGTPVRQRLPKPLEANAKYALEFAVQARPEGGERLLLEIRGANDECAVGDLLGTTPELPGGAGWTSVCVEFASTQTYKYLLLAPNAIGTGRASGASRLALDELRSVPGCGAATGMDAAVMR